jgi:hypothetical protein
MRLSSLLCLTALAGSLILLAGCGGDSKSDEPGTQAGNPPPAIDGPVILSIRIDEDLLPVERVDKYETPLRQALESAGIGEVKKSGAAYNRDWRIQNIVIITEVNDVAEGVKLLRKKLRELNAPKSTVIQQNQPYQYIYRVYDL